MDLVWINSVTSTKPIPNAQDFIAVNKKMTLENNKDGAPELHVNSSNDINNSSSIDAVTEDFNSISILEDNMSACACCGKEGNSDEMNTCNKCKMVKYCNAACKKKHRSKHKKKCERRVAEIFDEQLFKEPPSPEECPICMIPLPHISESPSDFQTCCGKRICNGCIYAMEMSEGEDLCAFCRTPTTTSNEKNVKRVKKLMDKGNAMGYNLLAGAYDLGERGLPRDERKANELWLKAGELGCAMAYYNLAESYNRGAGVEIDKNKAKHYWELAAMNGHILARIDLGYLELEADNFDQALKHWIIAAKAGHEDSLDNVTKVFKGGVISKDEYEATLRAHHERRMEMKSDTRDKAAEEERLARQH